MCGIYGVFNHDRSLSQSQLAWAETAQQQLLHRGPDAQQYLKLLNDQCLIGHLRLAIIDLACGAQPMSNEDQSVWVVFNGEIYNYLELRDQLVERGHQFSTHSDTEVLVHLFEERGTAMLDDLEGMFAFAIVDVRNRQLFLARDRFGEKPLYWAALLGGQGLAFASEMKALLSLQEVSRELDVAAMAQFLSLSYIPAPRTHLKQISKLRAGEALLLKAGSEPRIFRYWTPRFEVANGHKPPSKQAAIEQVRSRFRESLRWRLRSDVPVGVFLSGGVDSTLVASTVRELLPTASFKTFCATFDEDQLNEAPYARRIAEHIGSDHQEVHFASQDLLQIFDSLIDHYDEPFADPSMFPTFAVCRAARQFCKVMMSGDGGDEFFGGYRNFFSYSQWQGVRRFPGVNPIANLVSRGWGEKWCGRGTLGFVGKNDWQLLYSQQNETASLLSFQPECRPLAQQGLQELRDSASQHVHLKYPLSAMEYMASGYLPEQILVKVDRASMWSSVECRTPFLDRNLFNLAASLPVEYHFAGGQGKALLRQCLPDWVPPEIRWRSKQGFTPPLSTWLRTSLKSQMEDALADISGRLRGIFDSSGVRVLIEQHQAGADHAQALFRWLVLSRSTAGAGL